MNRKSFLIGFVTGIVLFIGFVGLVFYSFSVQPDISLTSMQLQDLSGKPINNADFSGKPLVVNYWATWCGPCLEEFPMFEKVKKSIGNDVNMIMVSDETADIVTPFKESKPYSFNYLLSTKPLEGMSVRPITYFYNSAGSLVSKVSGGMDEKSFLERINQIK